MTSAPKIISLAQIPDVIADRFAAAESVTCYVGSNAAVPTASLETLTAALVARAPQLPFFRMVHLLLQGPVPYVREGLQDRVMTYSLLSAGEVREAANVGRAYYLPCTLSQVHTLIDKGRLYQPDIVLFKVRQNPLTGEYSLGLSVEAMHTAIDHATLVIAERDETMPFTQGQSVVDGSSIDFLVEDPQIKPVYDFTAPDFDSVPPEDQRIGELITEHFIRDGSTIQVGIGKITDAVVGSLKSAQLKHLGVQTELYSDGLMLLQQLGIVTNRRKRLDMGYSTTSLIMGSKALYDYCHMRTGVQMRACGYTNAAATIRANAPFVSINTAIGVDLFGNVWADYIDATHYYSGVGGQPDFVRALSDPSYGTPIIALRSITHRGDSKIVAAHPPGVSLTASSYDGVVIVNEYGIADLRGLTAGERALAIASIAHPRYRDTLMRHVTESTLFTKPTGHAPRKRRATGVIEYAGRTPIGGEDCARSGGLTDI